MANLDFIKGLLATVVKKKRPSLPDYGGATPPFVGDTPLGERANPAEWANVPYSTDERGLPINPPSEVPVTRDAADQIEVDPRSTVPAVPPPTGAVATAPPVTPPIDFKGVPVPDGNVPIPSPYATAATKAQVSGSLEGLPISPPPLMGASPELLAAQAELASTINAPYKDNQKVPVLDAQGQPVLDPKTGKPKMKDHYTKKEKALAFLEGWARGGLFGGIDQARDRHFNERRGRQRDIADQSQKVGVLQGIDKSNAEIELRRQQAATIPIDDANKQAQIAAQAARDKATQEMRQRNYDRLVDAQKKKGLKVQEIDGYLNVVNPQTGEATPIIDPRTGIQAVNPANVTQRTTTDDGTSVDMQSGKLGSAKIAGDAAMGRQRSQQTFTAGENAKNRAQRATEFQTNYNLKVQAMKASLGKDAAALKKWQIDEELKVRNALKAKKMTKETADAMIAAIKQ